MGNPLLNPATLVFMGFVWAGISRSSVWWPDC